MAAARSGHPTGVTAQGHRYQTVATAAPDRLETARTLRGTGAHRPDGRAAPSTNGAHGVGTDDGASRHGTNDPATVWLPSSNGVNGAGTDGGPAVHRTESAPTAVRAPLPNGCHGGQTAAEQRVGGTVSKRCQRDRRRPPTIRSTVRQRCSRPVPRTATSGSERVRSPSPNGGNGPETALAVARGRRSGAATVTKRWWRSGLTVSKRGKREGRLPQGPIRRAVRCHCVRPPSAPAIFSEVFIRPPQGVELVQPCVPLLQSGGALRRPQGEPCHQREEFPVPGPNSGWSSPPRTAPQTRPIRRFPSRCAGRMNTPEKLACEACRRAGQTSVRQGGWRAEGRTVCHPWCPWSLRESLTYQSVYQTLN
jgi:hypothetical protein